MCMRKLILFFTSLSVILFFTSCLKAGDSSFSGQEEFFYITRQDGLQMAYNGNFAMTSAEIKAKDEINRWYRITWTWSTPNGMAAENANVHNAVTSHVEAVPLGVFLQQEAPEDTGVPVPNFRTIVLPVLPLPIVAGTFGDFLIIEYVWNKKEGEKGLLKLYNNATEVDDSRNTVTLDLRLEKSGTSTETTGKDVKEEAAVKMSLLRSLVDFNGQEFKDIQLKFNYYKGNAEQPASVTQTVRIYKN